MKYAFTLILFLASICCMGQSTQPLTRIGFGSCSKQDSVQMWQEVVEQKPQLWIWLGDIIYGDSRDMKVLRAKYDLQKNNPEYQRLLKTCPVIGTWDDHDYGQNDGDKYYSRKRESKEELLRFLDVSANDPVRNHEGVYSSFVYGGGTQKVKVILLDTRAFRDSLTKSKTPGKRYEVNEEGDILGESQWAWLESELKNSDAAINIIGSSIQFISNDHGYEKWGNFPKARRRILDLLARTKVNMPIIISGDRHMADISKMEIPGVSTPLYDFTSSGLTHTWPTRAPKTEKNQYRVGNIVVEKNFGMLLIDWTAKTPSLTFEVRGRPAQLLAPPVIVR
jgi:alkaline phosphatase D